MNISRIHIRTRHISYENVSFALRSRRWSEEMPMPKKYIVNNNNEITTNEPVNTLHHLLSHHLVTHSSCASWLAGWLVGWFAYLKDKFQIMHWNFRYLSFQCYGYYYYHHIFRRISYNLSKQNAIISPLHLIHVCSINWFWLEAASKERSLVMCLCFLFLFSSNRFLFFLFVVIRYHDSNYDLMSGVKKCVSFIQFSLRVTLLNGMMLRVSLCVFFMWNWHFPIKCVTW